MAYGVLEYSKRREDFLGKHKWLLKLPGRFYEAYLRKHLPYRTIKGTILDASGWTIYLPFVQSDAGSELAEELMEMLVPELRDLGIGVLKTPPGLPYEYDRILPACSGFYIWPFWIPAVVHKALKITGMDVEQADILIIDGLQDLTMEIIHYLSPFANSLSVITEESAYLEEESDRILEESGLNVQLYHSDTSIENADLILNASQQMHQMESRFRRGALYFDLAGNRKQTSRMVAKRPDMLIADGFQVKAGNQFLDNVLLEAVFYELIPGFRSYFSGRFEAEDMDEVDEAVATYQLPVTAFLRFGQAIRSGELEKIARG